MDLDFDLGFSGDLSAIVGDEMEEKRRREGGDNGLLRRSGDVRVLIKSLDDESMNR